MPQPLVCSEDRANGSRAQINASALSEAPLLVVEQIRRMRGGAQSHLMRCRDDGYYVVKFQGNPQGTRILVNELLGTLLAARLGLPTTPVAACHVREDLIRLTPDLCFQIARGRIPCRPGLHFGSRYVGDPRKVKVLDDLLLPDYELARAKNVADFAGMLVFDKWTCNTDGRQTVFIPTEGAYEAVMVDQGMCFNSSEWNFPDAPLRGLYARHVVYRGVHGIDNFEPWLKKLDGITEIVLMEIARKIPPEWYDGDWDALQQLLEQLDRRRNRVRELLWETRNARPYAFPNWIEGTRRIAPAIWQKRKEATATSSKQKSGTPALSAPKCFAGVPAFRKKENSYEDGQQRPGEARHGESRGRASSEKPGIGLREIPAEND